jgi:hypothetical protein
MMTESKIMAMESNVLMTDSKIMATESKILMLGDELPHAKAR